MRQHAASSVESLDRHVDCVIGVTDRGQSGCRVGIFVRIAQSPNAVDATTDSKGRIDSFAPEQTVCALSGEGTPDAYVALYSENGTKCAVYFEATAKALKIFRMYNAPATVTGKVRY